MRLLTADVQAPIWRRVEAAITDAGFAFTPGDARTISGEREGIFNLIALRHIYDEAGDAAASRMGALDLGGVSAQITFAPISGVVLDEAYDVSTGGDPPLRTRLYSHSYMRAGKDAALLRYAQRLSDDAGARRADGALASPCHNLGYNTTFQLRCGAAPRRSCEKLLIGTGDFDACSARVALLADMDRECMLEPCAMNGDYQPSAAGVPFVATAGFFYTANGLGLIGWDDPPKAISTAQLAEVTRRFCAWPWSTLGAHVPIINEFTAGHCFSGAYVAMMLSAYGIPEDSTNVTYARLVEDMKRRGRSALSCGPTSIVASRSRETRAYRPPQETDRSGHTARAHHPPGCSTTPATYPRRLTRKVYYTKRDGFYHVFCTRNKAKISAGRRRGERGPRRGGRAAAGPRARSDPRRRDTSVTLGTRHAATDDRTHKHAANMPRRIIKQMKPSRVTDTATTDD